MILLVGAGRMGYAMLVRWLDEDSNKISEDIAVLEPHPSSALLSLHEEKNFSLNPSLNPSLNDLGDKKRDKKITALVLAVKPDKILDITASLKDILEPESLLISIAAGQRLAPILQASGHRDRGAIRAMPNIPAQIGRGFVAFYCHKGTSAAQRALGLTLMSVLGKTAAVDNENLLDAATVLSGCGPAYLFYLAEILTAAGEELGLDRAWAQQAAITTLSGAAALLEDSNDAASLRQQVASPGGVTEAALSVLMENSALHNLFTRAFQTAHKKSVALGRSSSDR